MPNREGEVLSYEKVFTESGIAIFDVKCNLDDGNTVTARHYQSPGHACSPLVGDYAVLVEVAGEFIAVAFIDPKMAPEVGPGECLLYSRSAPGVIAAQALLKADGSIVLNQHVTISPDGIHLHGRKRLGSGQCFHRRLSDHGRKH